MAAKIFLRAQAREPWPTAVDYTAVLSLWPSPGGLTVHHNLEQLYAISRPAGPEYQTLLLLAIGVWAADKLLPRAAAPDAWTRKIGLEIPVSPAWMEPVTHLAPVLEFLTGDRWHLSPRPVGPELGCRGKWPEAWSPDLVCLFSGGVDSLVGAIDFLEAGYRLLLISHYDYGQLAGGQKALAAALARHYGPQRVRRLGVRVQFEAPELSLRSRSLLYIALGLTAAAAFGDRVPLLVAENGWISLNPPLTLNRLGSYSSRTTHPYFLQHLQTVCRRVGLRHPLVNPYQGQTKGDMLAQSRCPELLRVLLPDTLSCAHPVVSRWNRQRQGNCGYCFPCLLRRAALHRLGEDRGQDYLSDVLADARLLRHRVRGADLRALLFALKTWEESGRRPEPLLLRSGPLGAEGEAKVRLANAGLAEIQRWLTDKAHPHLKKFAGW